MTTTNRVQTARFALQMAAFAERIGSRMRERREALKAEDPRWTQEYAARQLPGEVSGTQWARWERGENVPREDTVAEIAKVLGFRKDDLYAGLGEDVTTVGPEYGYRAADVERAIRIEQKLDLLLEAAGLEWLDPYDLVPEKNKANQERLKKEASAAEAAVEEKARATAAARRKRATNE